MFFFNWSGISFNNKMSYLLIWEKKLRTIRQGYSTKILGSFTRNPRV